MSYPVIKNKQGQTLAVLNNILNPNVFEKINADYNFNFTAIIEELKTDYIQYGNQIEVDNQLFNIVTYTKERTQDNKMIVQVYCEHVSYELLEESTLFNHSNITAEEALTILLQDTPFKIGNVDYLGKYTFQRDEEEQNKRAQLIDIAQAFKGELVYRGYTVDLYSLRGANNGVQIRLGKNLKGIKQIIDGTKKDENGNPSVTYEINLLELVEAEEYKDFKTLETIRLGDTVRTIDEGLNIDFASRILEYEYDPVRKINSIVVIGNFVENIATDSIETRKVIKEVISKKDIWNRSKAINPDGTVSTAILEGDIDTANNLVKAGLGSVRITDNNGILILDNPDEMLATKALRLLGGVLAISNKKDQSGQWIWRTFGTGDGFVADEIVSGALYTSLISIVGNKDIPNAFKWDETGFRVHKLNQDNSIDLDTYILIDNEGIRFYENNNLVIDISFAEGGLKAIHSDGSYTKISDEGNQRFITKSIYTEIPTGIPNKETFNSKTITDLENEGWEFVNGVRISANGYNGDCLEIYDTLTGMARKYVYVTKDNATMSFRYKTYSTGDYFFRINGNQVKLNATNNAWLVYTTTVNKGVNLFQWHTSQDFDRENANILIDELVFEQNPVNLQESDSYEESRTYNYVTKVGYGYTYGSYRSDDRTLVYGTDYVSDVWVQLPDEFKGKDFQVFLCLKDTMAYGQTTWAISSIELNIKEIDYANARVRVSGKIIKSIAGSDPFEGDIYQYNGLAFTYFATY